MYYRGSKPGHSLGSSKKQCAADGRVRIWQAMRVMRRFKISDLEITTEEKNSTIGSFVRVLERSGYLRLISKAHGLIPGVYMLVRDTGPMPPIRRNDGSGCWDQNQQVLYPLRAKASTREGDAIAAGEAARRRA